VRGGEEVPLLFKEGWRAKRDGVVQDAIPYRVLMNYPG